MKNYRVHDLTVPAVILGCMRNAGLSDDELNRLIHTALDGGTNFFDHADIYAGGLSETRFGKALRKDPSLRREDMILQSKCGIRRGVGYDSSESYILEAVDGILSRLGTDYLDILLIHRPDALVEPEEVASAFDKLYTSGKVRNFGVSNHRSMQIELLKKYVKQPLIIDQMELSLAAAGMVAGGVEVNTTLPGAADRDGSILDYCRLNDITLQAWSPFQISLREGTFLGNPQYSDLNRELEKLAGEYGVSATTIAAAWILRHPAKIQLIAGTTNPDRLRQIQAAADISLTRAQWYELYKAAGHPMP